MYGFPFAKTDVAIGDLVAERATGRDRLGTDDPRRRVPLWALVCQNVVCSRKPVSSDVLVVSYAFGTRTLTILGLSSRSCKGSRARIPPRQSPSCILIFYATDGLVHVGIKRGSCCIELLQTMLRQDFCRLLVH